MSDVMIGKPDMYEWKPTEEETYFIYDKEKEVGVALYDKVGMVESPLWIYYVNKNHYKQRMENIAMHINYYLNFYDFDKELYMAMLSIKYMIDTKPYVSESTFRELVLDRIVTDKFIENCKQMSRDLYKIDTNTDTDGKYKNTPKITNAQAQMIISVSFAIRMLLPICLHYSNISTIFKSKSKTYYLTCFGKIFISMIRRFEKDDTRIYTPLCKFIDFRVDKSYSSNKLIHYQKKQIRGDSLELYKKELIIEVIIVKSLYKLDYKQSCVSFIDAVITNFNANYGRENYPNKPYEIDSSDSSSDSDDHLSRAEALEMQAYKLDESSPIISDANNKLVVKKLIEQYSAIEISDEEKNFYMENCKFNNISDFLLHSFYSKKFGDSYALYSLNKNTIILLVIYLKKIFQLYRMPLLAQILTAKITSKYKENIIKNAKFVESISSSNIYQQIISKKYQYLQELDSVDDPILKMLSAIINCSFEFVDTNPEINGFKLSSVDNDDIINEFLQFLSII